MALVELSCLVLLLAAAGLRSRGPGAREWLLDAPIVALGALLGEDSCIRLYGFYEYAPGWHGFLDRTPALIPLIWIFVVLSARDVARAFTTRALPLVAFGLVWFDASLIEPISTQAQLWHWSDAGPFGVPYIGTIGWACYGASMIFWLERLRGPSRALAVILAPLTMHALLLALWWGLLRWVGRGAAPSAGLVAAIAWGIAAALIVALVLSGRARRVPLVLIAPRLLPALFFFGLLAANDAPAALWAYAASFAAPWLVATRWAEQRDRAIAAQL
jgi:hypothetical protein